MKSIILSKNRYIYSTDALIKQFLNKGLEVEVINPLECNVHIEEKNSFITFNNKIINHAQYLIPRIGSASYFYGLNIVKAFEELNIPSLNSYDSLLNSRNKYNAFQLLSQNNIPTPKATLVKSACSLDIIVDKLGGFPIIAKLSRGSQGKGVMIADNINSLQSIIDTITLLDEELMVQKYYPTIPENSDIRIYVLNSKVIGSAQRINKADFRSNTHCGGSIQKISIDSNLEKLAIKVSQLFQLNFCSVDILNTENGYQVLEVNSTPGFEMAEKQAGIDLSNIVVDYISEQLCLTSTKI